MAGTQVDIILAAVAVTLAAAGQAASGRSIQNALLGVLKLDSSVLLSRLFSARPVRSVLLVYARIF